MAEEDVKMPWESKTEIIAFIGIVSGLLVSFGVAGASLTVEQISGLAVVMFTLIAIARKYGGGLIATSEADKEQKIVEVAEKAAVKAEKLEATQ